jgi:hypothetical protein
LKTGVPKRYRGFESLPNRFQLYYLESRQRKLR